MSLIFGKQDTVLAFTEKKGTSLALLAKNNGLEVIFQTIGSDRPFALTTACER